MGGASAGLPAGERLSRAEARCAAQAREIAALGAKLRGAEAVAAALGQERSRRVACEAALAESRARVAELEVAWAGRGGGAPMILPPHAHAHAHAHAQPAAALQLLHAPHSRAAEGETASEYLVRARARFFEARRQVRAPRAW